MLLSQPAILSQGPKERLWHNLGEKNHKKHEHIDHETEEGAHKQAVHTNMPTEASGWDPFSHSHYLPAAPPPFPVSGPHKLNIRWKNSSE